MSAHAKLSASGAHRWMACPGSINAEDGIPDRTSSFAEEGTQAHNIMEAALTGAADCSKFTDDKEMSEFVQIYVDYVQAIHKKGWEIMIERRVDFSEWVPEGFGTADTIVVGDDWLHIIDLKYGKGVQVFAENNPQAMLYALGAYNALSHITDIETVRISIVQPRLDHISEWEISVTDLLKFGETARMAAEATQDPDAKRVPGEKQCRFCKAKATCPALYKLTSDTIAADFDQIDEVPPPNKLTDAQLAKAMESKGLIEAWLSAVEVLVKNQIASGKGFKGFKLVEGRSVRRWVDEKEAVDTLFDFLSEKEIFTQKIISPAQAEKLLGKKDKDKIKDLIIKPIGSPTLAKDNDPRPAIESVDTYFQDLDANENEI